VHPPIELTILFTNEATQLWKHTPALDKRIADDVPMRS